MNYRSRAAFKLAEIDQRFKFFKPGHIVYDFGCSPGGWVQVAVECTQSTPEKPTIFGIDLLETEEISGAKTIIGDLLKQEDVARLRLLSDMKQANSIVSDMAPNFCGSLDVDFYKISELNMLTMSLAQKMLRPGGSILVKTLSGADEPYYFVITK